MDIVNKIDNFISEAVVPSQNNVISTMGKGLSDVSDWTSSVGLALWHYFNPKITGGPIFKTQSSNRVIDELWYRIGKNIEDTERLTDNGLKKLKANFYSFSSWLDKLYKLSSDGKKWDWVG